MRITIVAVGLRMPSWVNQGVLEYSKRIPAEMNVSIVEVPAGKRTKSTPVDKILKQEAERISAAIPQDAHIVVLDERGRSQRTSALAGNMSTWMQNGRNVALVIGGADGLHSELKTRAHEIWSLSDLTLPHGLARVCLVEQLYRAWSLTRNHPYHRE